MVLGARFRSCRLASSRLGSKAVKTARLAGPHSWSKYQLIFCSYQAIVRGERPITFSSSSHSAIRAFSFRLWAVESGSASGPARGSVADADGPESRSFPDQAARAGPARAAAPRAHGDGGRPRADTTVCR